MIGPMGPVHEVLRRARHARRARARHSAVVIGNWGLQTAGTVLDCSFRLGGSPTTETTIKKRLIRALSADDALRKSALQG